MARKAKPTFRNQNTLRVRRRTLPPGFDFEVFQEEERILRDLRIWHGISPEEADELFPGTQPFVSDKEVRSHGKKLLK